MKCVSPKVCLMAAMVVLVTACTPAPEASRLPADRVATTSKQADPSPLDATYLIDDTPVTLVDGHAEVAAAPGSATKELTYVRGEPIYGDLDGDGDADAAVVLIRQSGGSGTFSYLAAAVRGAHGYTGTNGIFLGDRIDRLQLTMDQGVVRAQFLDRPEGASFSDAPTVRRSVEAKLKGLRLQVP